MRSSASASSTLSMISARSKAEVLQTEGHLAHHLGSQDLPFGILQHRADLLRDRGELPAAGVLTEDQHAARHFPFVGPWHQPIDGTDEGRLSAAAGAGD